MKKMNKKQIDLFKKYLKYVASVSRKVIAERAFNGGIPDEGGIYIRIERNNIKLYYYDWDYEQSEKIAFPISYLSDNDFLKKEKKLQKDDKIKNLIRDIKWREDYYKNSPETLKELKAKLKALNTNNKTNEKRK